MNYQRKRLGMDLAIRKEVEQRVAAKNLSVSEIERQAGLKQGVLRNILQGKSKNPTVQVLVSLTKVLDCSIEELIGLPNTSDTQNTDKTPTDKLITSKKYDKINYQLLENVFKLVSRESEKLAIKPSLSEFLNYISDIYSFSDKTGSNIPNKNFCEWFFERFK